MTHVSSNGITVHIKCGQSVTICHHAKAQVLELDLDQVDTVINALKISGLYYGLLQDPLARPCPNCGTMRPCIT
jgi:hypothetical protein